MSWSRALVLLLALVVLWAPPVAASQVPDPTWVGGLWDGADGDELVTLVWDQSPAVTAVVIVLAHPVLEAQPVPATTATAECHFVTPESSRDPPVS